ncbi:hypothetical protein RhiirC2_718278 [Rhizophagus irregularis]|uniref:Uncharacterized protein n=1 Tax=Rhizophagus irregularis TaxID=588596 RepID=A0A2N1MJ55_9GLOM|nr:hypothetical protein RhiirC2_718278 [Rhizophagus irregularis]
MTYDHVNWVLELLQVPRVKEGLEEDRKKYFNLTAFKEWEEAGELLEEDKEALCMKTEQNEARHGANSQSVDCNTESKSVGTSRCVITNGRKREARSTCEFYPSKDRKPWKQLETSHSDIVNEELISVNRGQTKGFDGRFHAKLDATRRLSPYKCKKKESIYGIRQ